MSGPDPAFGADFAASLLDPSRAVPSTLRGTNGAPAGRRFSVYRNNVTVSLRDALGTAFPLLRKLVGDAFEPLALAFLRSHPPTTPVMMFYGDEMPSFLASYAPLAHVGYLPDCARLDLALRRSYHAADHAPPDPAAFQVDPDALLALRLSPAPSCIVIRSAWPLYDIWRYTFERDAEKPAARPQDVLVARPDYDPAPHPLPPGAADWLEALGAGRTLGAAFDAARAGGPDFDLAATLRLALDTGALAMTQEAGT